MPSSHYHSNWCHDSPCEMTYNRYMRHHHGCHKRRHSCCKPCHKKCHKKCYEWGPKKLIREEREYKQCKKWKEVEKHCSSSSKY